MNFMFLFKRYVLLILISFCFANLWSQVEVQNPTFPFWKVNGNGGTVASTAAIGATVNNNFIGTIDSKDFILATNSLERLRVTAAGDVGIGIIMPLRKLHLAGATSGFRYAGVATGGSFISAPSATTDKLLFADANGDVRALGNGTNGQTLQIVSGYPQWSSGLVGPTGAAGTNGTNGAAGPAGATGATGPTGPSGSGSSSAWDLTGNTGTAASTATIGNAVNNNFIGTMDSVDFVLATNNLERMRLLADGRLAVGTVLPTTGANVEFSYPGDVILRLHSPSGGRVGLDLLRQGAGSADWRIANESGALSIVRSMNDFATNPTDGFRFSAVGTALHPIVDNVKTLGTSTLAWSGVYSYAYPAVSDQREKTNIQPINYGLKEVLKLRPVYYNWVKYPEDGLRLGLIAQELKTVLPEVVKDWEWKVDEQTGERTKVEAARMGVMYTDIVPVLIKAIQEQEINAQKSREEIELLKKELSILKESKQ